ncbi:MAG: dipeptide/oligopeptide/nickel ABC transporter permease/ATP-binding protein, partial [Acidimicrobiia bacterium]
VLSLPVLPLTIVVGVFLGPGISTQVIVIAAVIWAGVARELRAQVLSVRERDHVAAARSMGGGARYVLRRHVAPAVAPLVVPQFVLATKTAILLEASLAFLGLGDVRAQSWGTMLFFAHSRSAFLTDAWLWWVIPPGAAIAATVTGFALLGYAFEERARPSLGDRPARPLGRARSRPDEQARPDGGQVGDGPVAVRSAAAGAGGDAGVAWPLVVEGLTVVYRSGPDGGEVTAVDDVSLSVAPGELLGLVGESGCGKSTLAAVATGLLPAAGTVTGGRVVIGGHDLGSLPAGALRRLRGDRVALVPQEAMSALNPVLTIRAQLAEAVRAHRAVSRSAAEQRVGELLELVRLDPGRSRDYPHQLSGGMRQRVVIAMALANDPALVVADEPTSGLDVLVAADLLDLLDDLRRRFGLALLVISHDLPVVERVADRIAVMHRGALVEVGPATQVSAAPGHPYTRRLVGAVPRLRLPAGEEAR